MDWDIFDDHVQTRMQSLSIFAYSESTDFSEFFDMSYILASVLWAEKHIYECCTRGIWGILFT